MAVKCCEVPLESSPSSAWSAPTLCISLAQELEDPDARGVPEHLEELRLEAVDRRRVALGEGRPVRLHGKRTAPCNLQFVLRFKYLPTQSSVPLPLPPHFSFTRLDEAVLHCTRGLGIWPWAGNDDDGKPDVVMACAGDAATVEALAATALLRAGHASAARSTAACASEDPS
jgi:hypothetical protein